MKDETPIVWETCSLSNFLHPSLFLSLWTFLYLRSERQIRSFKLETFELFRCLFSLEEPLVSSKALYLSLALTPSLIR